MADKEKVGAYGTKASEAGFRKRWDKEEYAAKAKAGEEEERERIQENEERLKQGTFPSPHRLPTCVSSPWPGRQETPQGP
jgi:hypothetical protein